MRPNPKALNRLFERPMTAAGTGAILFLISVPLHLLAPDQTSVLIAALTLTLIAGAYIGFGAASGQASTFWQELTVALLFSACAFAGLTFDPRWIPAGLAAHAAWDIYHHNPRRQGAVPRWYIPFCATFDLAAAVFLLIRLPS